MSEPGIVVATRGRRFEVRLPDKTHLQCELRQKVKFRTEKESPVVVGDDVEVTAAHRGAGVIDAVLPRRTAFFRPAKGLRAKRQTIAANLDQLAAVASVASPPLKTGLIDRVLLAGEVGSLKPIVIINKIDLGRPDDLSAIEEAYRKAGYPVVMVSARAGDGMGTLEERLRGHRTLFVGHSGVGKSTLLNCLIPGLALKTGEISDYSNRGTHVTTSIRLFELPSGGFAVDSPGLKVMGLWDVDKETLPDLYPDFRPYATECRFQPCSHTHEPGCAVRAAAERGEIGRFRYDNYLHIATSLDAPEQ